MLITRAEIAGRAPLDVRLVDGRIAEIGPDLSRDAREPRLDAAGGALIPGLHDHHLHLFALAAADTSVRCGPPEVRDLHALARALAQPRAPGEWIRGVGYHEVVAGALDRAALDALVPDRPARIQHRSGALWLVNSAAIDRLGLDRSAAPPGVERDASGRATGRLFRVDAWLREQLETARPPGLARVSRHLAACGVTGLTDATPGNGGAELAAFAACIERGELLQRLVVMGEPGLPRPRSGSIERGPVKLLLEERDLPRFDALREMIREAHREDRPVAIHCVTRVELVLAATALAAAGSREGDRIEHASVAPPDVVALLADLPLTVVTQPGFIFERGDAYLVDVEPGDRSWLYRGRGFLRASVPLGGATDAPFGDPDPWRAMQASVSRRTEGGITLGPEERLTPEEALALFTSAPAAPGGPPRPIAAGAPADLCLLDRPWSSARLELSSARVAATIRGGAVIWRRA